MAECTDTSRVQSKGSIVFRNALITPSASPPAPSTALSNIHSKSASRPPPFKRARVYSTSSSPQRSNRGSSSSSRAEVVDPTRDEAWRASSKRLLDVWSSLAERYNVPLDQDDIIDLRTVELVKDRGVIRRANSSFDIGYFGDPKVNESEGGEDQDGSRAEDEVDEDEVDEIDALTSEPSVPVKIEMEKVKRHVPPFQAGDPDDASDLREFLEEERRRRKQEREDADAHEDSDTINLLDESSDEGGNPHPSRSSSPDVSLRSHRDVDQVCVRASPGLARRSRPPPVARRVTAEYALTAPEDDSDDELLTYEIDELAPVTVPPRPPAARPGPTQANIDSTTPSPPLSPTIRGRPQLRTQMTTRPCSPTTPSTSQARSLTRNLQLQTPPNSHSASSVADGTPDTRSSPTMRASLSPTEPQISRVEMSPVASSSRSVLPPPSSPAVSSTPYSTTSVVPKHIVEVVLPKRNSLMRPHHRARTALRDAKTDSEAYRSNASSRSKNSPQTDQQSTNKGEGKQRRRLPVFADLSDDEPLPPPPRFRRSNTQPPVSSSRPKTVRRKRKRSSASSASTSSLGNTTTPVTTRRTNTQAQRSPSEPVRDRGTAIAKGKGKGNDLHLSVNEFDTDHFPASQSRKTDRHRSSSQPRASVHTGSEAAPPMFPFPPPRMYPAIPALQLAGTSDQSHRHYPPQPPIQDPQTQYELANAVNYLSYVLTQRTGYPPPGSHAYRQSPAYWPQTPQHRSRGRTRGQSTRGQSSSPPRRSLSPGIPFAYTTTARGYPSPSDPAYSSASSPPVSSSPAPSSPIWPMHHPFTNGQARSKSRGRKVSFKLDSDDEQHPREHVDGKKSRTGNNQSNPVSQSEPAKRPLKQPSSSRRYVKNKSSDEGTDMRQSRDERGRTPGPSSRHSRSYSARQ